MHTHFFKTDLKKLCINFQVFKTHTEYSLQIDSDIIAYVFLRNMIT